MSKTTLAIVCLALGMICGCSDMKRPIGLSLSPTSAQSIDDGETVAVTATLINDTKGQGVTWSMTGGGSLTGQTSTGVTFQAPVSGAASNATITATSVSDSKITASLTISVSPAPTFGSISLPNATEGAAYSQSVTATGGAGALTYSLASGSLPAGLNLNGSTGAITGTSTGPTGKSTFTVKATDSSTAGAKSATSASVSITVILPANPSITTTSLPGGQVGTSYNQSITTTGGVAPLTLTIGAGTLPPGLTISGPGTISGTPTTVGTYAFTVKVTDSATPTPQTGTKALSIAVAAAATPLSITTSSLSGGTVGSAYSATLQSNGGIAPVTWSVTAGTLPAGLSLNSSTAAISGTPTTVGTSSFTVQAADSGSPQQKVTKALSITVVAATASCNPANTGSESLLKGQYAMVLEGYDAAGPVLLGVTFDADGAGHLASTVGLEDVLRFNSVKLAVAIDSASSSYNVGSDHRGCLRAVTSSGTQLFRIAVGAIVSGVATRLQAIEADNSGTNVSGSAYLQDSTAFSAARLSGNYAFGVGAPLQGTGRTRYAAAGIFNLDGNFTVSGELDTNDSGTFDGNGTNFPTTPISIPSTGTYSVSSNGRGKLTFTEGLGGNTSNTIIYVIASDKFLIMSYDSEASFPVFAGEATLQTGTPYSSASMNANAVFGTKGVNGSTDETEIRVGLLQPQIAEITYFVNSGGGLGSLTGPVTYTVDSAGRVQMANSSTGGWAILYLSAPNQGYILFAGTSPATSSPDVTVSSGFFVPQTGTPYNDPTMGGGVWALGSLGADSASSIHTDGNATFATNPMGFAGWVANGTTDTNAAGTLSVGAAYSERFFIADPTTGSANWTDDSLTILSRGFVVSPKAILAIDSSSSSTSTLIYYVAE